MSVDVSLRVLVVVTLVLVAGCGGTGPNSPVNDGNDGNAENDGASGDVTTIAPGVGEDAGLVNASALLWSHRRSLNESGFTYRFSNNRTERTWYADNSPAARAVRDSNASDVIAVRGRVAAEAGLSPYLVEETDSETDPATRTVTYVGPDGSAERIVRGDNATVEPYYDEPTVLLTEHYLLGNFLDRGDWTVSDRREDTVVLEAGPAWSDWQAEHIGETNISTREYFEGELVVSRDGRIRRLTVNRTRVERVERNGSLHSRHTTVRLFEYELLETNGTDVERPSWVPVARNGTAADTASRNETTAGG